MSITPGDRISKQASVESTHPENQPVLKHDARTEPAQDVSEDEKEKVEEMLPQDSNKEDFPDGGVSLDL